MKNSILGFLFLFALQVSAQTDPTLRINQRLRQAGGKGLSDRNYTAADSIKLRSLAPTPGWLPATDPGYTTQSQVSNLIQQAGVGSGVSSYLQLTDKPNFSTVALSGSYADLLGKPSTFAPSAHAHPAGDITLDATHRFVTDAQIAGWNSSTGSGFSGIYTDLVGRPVLSSVATSGLYADLSGKPSLSTVGISGLWGDIINKPSFSAVASTGNYSDLLGRPTIPTVPTLVSAFSNDAAYRNTSQVATQIRDSLATVPPLSLTKFVVSGGYIESRPAWGDVSGKPTFSSLATSGTWLDIASKPTTVSGYGITDAYTKAQTAQVVADSASTINYVGATVAKSGRTYTVTITANGDVTKAYVDAADANLTTTNTTQDSRLTALETKYNSLTAMVASMQTQQAANTSGVASISATQETNLARLNSIEQQLAQTSTVASPTITAGTVTSATAGITVTQAGSATSTTVYVSTNNTFTSGVISRSLTASGTASFTGLASGTTYYARANSLGSSGPASPYSATISFATSASVTPSSSVTVTSFPSMQDLVVSTNSTGGTRFSNSHKPASSSDHAVLSNYKLTPAQSGTVTMSTTLSAVLGGTAYMALDSNNTVYTGNGTFKNTVWANYNGSVFQVLAKSVNVFASNNPTIAAGTPIILRIVATATGSQATDSTSIDYSVDGGATFINRQTKLSFPAGVTPYDRYVKFDHIAGTSSVYSENIVITGFTPVTLTQTATPTVTVTSLSSTSFQLTASDVGAETYDFDISTTPDFSSGNSWNASSSASRTMNRTSLTANTTYYYRLKAQKTSQIDSPVVSGSVTTNP